MRKLHELKSTLRQLAAHRAHPSVSIYAPLAVAGPDVQKNPIELKNLTKQAQALLSPGEAEDLAQAIAPLASSEAAKRNHTPGLAIFHAPDRSDAFELPVQVAPTVVVEDRFHLKPLLALLARSSRFYVLALSQKQIRLVGVDTWGAKPVHTNGALPASLASLAPARNADKQLQFHSGSRSGKPVYHGQGQGEYRREEDLRRYLLAIDAGLKSLLSPGDLPLVLAGVAELTNAFRMLTRHPNVARGQVAGNVDDLSDHELAERARPLAQIRLQEGERRIRKLARDLAHTEYTTSTLDDTVLAAYEGRIDKLFLQKNAHYWGHVDQDARTVSKEPEQTPENEDLLDSAAIQTFDKGGEVYVVDAEQMPIENTPVFAVLRY